MNKKWVLGDPFGRSLIFMLWGQAGCGVRPTPRCEVAGMLITPLPPGQRGANGVVSSFVSVTEEVGSSGEKEQA